MINVKAGNLGQFNLALPTIPIRVLIASVVFFALVGAFAAPASAQSTCGPVVMSSSYTIDPEAYTGPRTAGTTIGSFTVSASLTCTGITAGSQNPPHLDITIRTFDSQSVYAIPAGPTGVNLRYTNRTASGCAVPSNGQWHVLPANRGFGMRFRVPTAGGCTATHTQTYDIVLTGQPISIGLLFPNTRIFRVAAYDYQNTTGVAAILEEEPIANYTNLSFNLNTTCELRNSSDTLTLPTVDTDDLTTAGQTAGQTPYTIFVDNCTFPAAPGNYRTFLFFGYTPGSASDRIANNASTPAANVEVQILDGNNPSQVVANGTGLEVLVTGAGSYGFPIIFRYRANGPAGPGQYSGLVNIGLAYL